MPKRLALSPARRPRTSLSSVRNSTSSKTSLPALSPTKKRIDDADLIFRMLKVENPAGRKMLADLGRKMLRMTKAAVARRRRQG